VKRFAELSEQEILALAISSEDEDSRIYRGFAEGLREPFPASAKVFDEMADEEVRHRTMLFDMYREKFGEYLPLIRRQDVRGFVHHSKPLWLMRPLGLDEVRKFAARMEYEAERFYRRAAETPATSRFEKLLLKLAEIEAEHETLAQKLGETILTRTRAPRRTKPSAHVRAAIRAAGAGRADGRFGLDLGAAVCGRLRHPSHLGDLPGRACGLGRRRHSPWRSPRLCPTTVR
jgi:Uncharacterized conserved protein